MAFRILRRTPRPVLLFCMVCSLNGPLGLLQIATGDPWGWAWAAFGVSCAAMTAAIIRAMGCRMTGQSATINWRQVRQDLRIPPELVCVVVLVLAYAWWDSAVALDAWARDVPRRLRARYILDPACIGDHGARGAQ